MVKNDIYKRYNVKRQSIILNHIQNNIREYIIASTIFIIGILLGIIVLNNLSDLQIEDIQAYIIKTIDQLKTNNNLDDKQLFIMNVKQDIIIVALMWILGSTIIGLLLVYIIVAFKRFLLWLYSFIHYYYITEHVKELFLLYVKCSLKILF